MLRTFLLIFSIFNASLMCNHSSNIHVQHSEQQNVTTTDCLIDNHDLLNFTLTNFSYTFYGKPTMQFSDAEHECEKSNKNLFVPSTLDELHAVAALIPEGECFWIGMKYINKNFTWLRDWGVNIAELPFEISDDESYGHVNEENCLSCHIEKDKMMIELHWNNCSSERPFLCQQEASTL
ncbi:hypothetical protein T11_18403 [Trichinella zimbabwensis]|uniref:C-type lectin domain-containing protein n=1 Tax=Trichinella zimbabwensis TaxID=268475 RepID=A0A0V1I739_9BILA|nr:hypothetical protein T11_18403 [Trichinella zimbabwensis]